MRSAARRLLPPLRWRDDRLAEQQDLIRALRVEVRSTRRELDRSRRELDAARAEREATREALAAARDELAAARDEVRRGEAALLRPSFHREILELRRSPTYIEQVDPEDWLPTVQLPFKLRNYRLAASHGVRTPRVLASWLTNDEITLEGLPAGFVLKSDGGASGDGVFPVRSAGDGAWQLLPDGSPVDEEQLRDGLRPRPGVRAPYFAEELLEAPDGGLPDDVKLYSFYGEVAQILLRRRQAGGDGRPKVQWRFVDEDGRSLDTGAVDRAVSDDIPVPDRLPEMVQAARHLSRAVGVPFCRVDMYQVGARVLLGEITRAPGGQQRYSQRHDEVLGEHYARARARLDLDLAHGRPAGILHGSHPSPDLYPPGHPSRSEDPGPWAARHEPCDRWCQA